MKKVNLPMLEPNAIKHLLAAHGRDVGEHGILTEAWEERIGVCEHRLPSPLIPLDDREGLEAGGLAAEIEASRP